MTCSSSAQSTSGSMPVKWKPDPTYYTAIWMRGDDCRALISSSPDFPSFCINKVNNTPFPWVQQPWTSNVSGTLLHGFALRLTVIWPADVPHPASGLRQLYHSFFILFATLFSLCSPLVRFTVRLTVSRHSFVDIRSHHLNAKSRPRSTPWRIILIIQNASH